MNEEDFDMDHTDGITSASPQADVKTMEDPTIENVDDSEEGDICYEWNEETQKMTPIMIKRSKHADLNDSQTNKRGDTSDTDDFDADDFDADTGWDSAYYKVPEQPDRFAQDVNTESTSIANVNKEDEYEDDMVNINNYLQTTKERLVPRNLENWWDRDDDLVNKAKRKTKLASIRKAQDEPLHKRCKTCPVCKRVFKGHAAMVDHAINKGNCSKDIDDSTKEQLKAQKIEMKTKRKEKRQRKRNFTIDDLF